MRTYTNYKKLFVV